MNDAKLLEKLHSLTLAQKVGQLVQLNAGFFDENTNTVTTGPGKALGIRDDYDLYNTGSVLNLFDPAKLYALQKSYLEKAKHGIPMLFFGDVIYGFSTIFPIPLAQGCSFNPAAIAAAAQTVAAEMTAAGVHSTFSPMVDLVRDPRWGRVMESPGESPLLCANYAKSTVQGFQGAGAGPSGPIEKNRAAACIKHFAAYGAPESGREYAAVEMSEAKFYGEYLPGYAEGIKAGSRLVMTAFNTLNGQPCTGSQWVNRQVLRGDCGFGGVLISDHTAVQELVAHGVAADDRHAALLAIRAGVDIDMMSPCYSNHLADLVESGEVDEALLDEAVLRVLRLKNDLGLFEDPYRGLVPQNTAAALLTPAAKQQATQLAQQTAVLLKNENNTLPLAKTAKVALIGPYAKNQATLGMWAFTGDKANTVTLYDGMAALLGEENITCAQGSPLLDDYSEFGDVAPMLEKMDGPAADPAALLDEAKQAAAGADVIVLAVGEHNGQSGEGASRVEPVLPAAQQRLVAAMAQTGKPVVLVVYAGRPLLMAELEKQAAAILYAWLPGTMGGAALANLLCGVASPSGRLSITFPRSVGQIPIYHSMLPTGRPQDVASPKARFKSHYLDEENTPLYPFGYGLSYTSFAYGGLAVSAEKLTEGQSLTAGVRVKNTGKTAAEEVVQLYLHDEVGSVSRPAKQLAAYQRVALAPGEEKTVEFTITPDMLAFCAHGKEKVVEPGWFTLLSGAHSGALDVCARFEYC